MSLASMFFRRFRSPLLGTALVLSALALLAVPLHQLTTSRAEHQKGSTADRKQESKTTRAILRIRVLDAWQDWQITTNEGTIVHRAASIEPGETEVDVEVLLVNEELNLEWSGHTEDKETAVFLTLLPDGREERTAYAIGSGEWRETLNFCWKHDH